MALVENHLLKQVIWDYTSKPFMKVTKNLNVTLVENHLHFCLTWEVISKPFMKCGSSEKSITKSTSLRVHIKTIHEHHKDFKCEYYGNLRIYMKKMIKKIQMWHLWKIIFSFSSSERSKPFMNVKKILHVILVKNYFVILITWGKTIMKIKKISNVTLVQNHFLILIIWEYTSKPFLNVKKISNVILF